MVQGVLLREVVGRATQVDLAKFWSQLKQQHAFPTRLPERDMQLFFRYLYQLEQ